MNEIVTDIPTVLAGIESKISMMQKTIDDRYMQICNLTRSNERLSKENHELKKRLSQYE